MATKKQNLLKINGRLSDRGIDIFVGSKKFPIVYPKDIWQKIPADVGRVLLENIVFCETNYLPLLLNKDGADYNFNYPLFEPVFFKNQLFDMLDCEASDGVQFLSYLKKFYNLTFRFCSLKSSLPKWPKYRRVPGTRPKAVLPFSFGKESLVSVAICLEVGIEPILVYCEEPVQPYERDCKLKLLKKIANEFKIKVHFIEHKPGLFRYGYAFNLKRPTEIGWGHQTTLLSLLTLPFVYYYQAQYVLTGSEYQNNFTEMRNGWRVFYSIDQTEDFTAIKNNLLHLMTGGQCEVKNTLEAFDEIHIFYTLFHRYPRFAKYLFSCMAENPLYRNSHWCHRCHKCGQNFLYARALGFDPSKVGFQENLLAIPGFFDNGFQHGIKVFLKQELDFPFHILAQRGDNSFYVKKFKQKIIPLLLKHNSPSPLAHSWQECREHYTKIHPANNLPEPYGKKILKVLADELASFKKIILP